MEGSSFFQRLKQGLTKSRETWVQKIGTIFQNRCWDEASLDEMEESLITADVGVKATQKLMETLRRQSPGSDVDAAQEMSARLQAALVEILQGSKPVPRIEPLSARPWVVLFLGVNGVGKTTTIGKLAAKLSAEGRKVMLAAGDTFRAAAIEQLKIWGERTKSPVIAGAQGSDSASLAFNALSAAREGKLDVLLIDTAGRLQNKAELMNELEKVVRVIKKIDASAPHAVLLVLDATVGQNALSQVEAFHRTAGVTGLVMTKLDGTARGGILVALAEKHKLPVHFIGVGEGIDDLAPFTARDFAQAIAGIE